MAQVLKFPVRTTPKPVEATVDRMGGYQAPSYPGRFFCVMMFAEFPNQPLTIPAKHPAIALTRPGDKVRLLANESQSEIHFENLTANIQATIDLRVAA